MKKILFLPMLCLFITACASTGAGKSAQDDVFEAPPLFLDWQYKGFGQEYPQWAEDALKEGESATVTIQFGQNLDMLIPHEQEEAEEAEENAENVVKQTWVYIDPYYEDYEERYVYIRIVEE
ncbi:MAG: hypothetical protein J5687_09100 [Treponema sp.]|nr:hypothetical protein [Treponema sp.]